MSSDDRQPRHLFTFRRVEKDTSGYYFPRWDKAVTVTAYGTTQDEAATKVRTAAPAPRRGWEWALALVKAEEVDPPARDVGPCTETLRVTLVDLHGGPDEHMTTPCNLDHGHTGAHRNDEDGTTWATSDAAARVPAVALDTLLSKGTLHVLTFAEPDDWQEFGTYLRDQLIRFAKAVGREPVSLDNETERVTGE